MIYLRQVIDSWGIVMCFSSLLCMFGNLYNKRNSSDKGRRAKERERNPERKKGEREEGREERKEERRERGRKDRAYV